MASNISLALVGAGYWGKKLLPKFIQGEAANVKIVCDLHPESRAAIDKIVPGLRTTRSYDDIVLDPGIDAVILATPPATHYSLARQALESGKHVWIEKPLALCADEGRELVALSRTKNKILFVDHTFLYDPAIRKIREIISADEFGEVYHVYSQRLNLGRIKRDSNVWWNSAPHDVSIVLYLLGSAPKSIALHGYRYLQPGFEDLNIAVLEMTDGASAFIYHNWLFPENTAKLTVVGSKQMLVYEGKFEKRALTLYEYRIERQFARSGDSEELPTTIPSEIISATTLTGVTDREPLVLAVEDFLASIRQAHSPLSDGEFSLGVLNVLEAGEKSLRSAGTKTTI
jgi:predicted dehydrogenase